MEPSGRNRWQPMADGTRSKDAQTGPARNRWQPPTTVPQRMVKRLFATGCRFPLPAREGVDQGLLTEIGSREPQGLQDSIGP